MNTKHRINVRIEGSLSSNGYLFTILTIRWVQIIEGNNLCFLATSLIFVPLLFLLLIAVKSPQIHVKR